MAESSQPSLQQAYETTGNPVTKEPAEQKASKINDARVSAASNPAVETRTAQDAVPATEATPSSLGRGVQGAGPGEEAKGLTEEDVGRHNELDGAQMAAPGEGKVFEAVKNKPGATGEQPDLASDLDRKKAEQAPAREAMIAEREKNVDVGGILGQRGGPASTVK